MSTRGKCQECSLRRNLESIAQMARHEGPIFQRWRRNHAAAVGAVLIDEPRQGR